MKKKMKKSNAQLTYQLEMGRGGGLFATKRGAGGCGLMLERILAYIH